MSFRHERTRAVDKTVRYWSMRDYNCISIGMRVVDSLACAISKKIVLRFLSMLKSRVIYIVLSLKVLFKSSTEYAEYF